MLRNVRRSFGSFGDGALPYGSPLNVKHCAEDPSFEVLGRDQSLRMLRRLLVLELAGHEIVDGRSGRAVFEQNIVCRAGDGHLDVVEIRQLKDASR